MSGAKTLPAFTMGFLERHTSLRGGLATSWTYTTAQVSGLQGC